MPSNTPDELIALINSSLPSSGSSSITAADLRAVCTAIANGQSPSYRKVTASGAVTVDPKDDYIEINKTVNEVTAINLPSSPITNKPYFFKDGKGNAASYNLNITPPNGVTIETASVLTIKTNYGFTGLYHNGTEWKIFR